MTRLNNTAFFIAIREEIKFCAYVHALKQRIRDRRRALKAEETLIRMNQDYLAIS